MVYCGTGGFKRLKSAEDEEGEMGGSTFRELVNWLKK
jgi:hypothetical protein